MVTTKLLPIFVMAIAIFVLAVGGLALLGCGNQRQVAGNATQASNQTLSKIDAVDDTSDVATVPGSSLVGDVALSGAQEHATQLAMPNPRQHVLSSGFPARDY